MSPSARLVAALLFGAACAAPTPPEIGPAADALLDQLRRNGRFTGAVIIGDRGRILYEGARGFANQERRLAFSPDTPVDGASLAKTFVAASVWQLVAEDALQLEAPVVRYVPAFPHRETTVAQLLDHSAGLAELADATGLDNEGIARAIDETPVFTPGSRFAYCNECFDVLALVLERASRQPWASFLERRFFEPLGLDSAFLRPARLADWPGARAVGYERIGDSLVLRDIEDDERFYGSSNIWLSARDLHRWVTAMLEGSIVPESVRARAHAITRFANGERSALNRLNWYHGSPEGPYVYSGHLGGFHHEAYWDPGSGISVVWVSNVLGGRPAAPLLTRALLRIAAGEQVSRVPTAWFERPSPGSRVGIAGRYALPDIGTVTIRDAGELIGVQVGDGAVHDGYPLTGFFVPDLDVEVGFSDPGPAGYETLHWLSTFDSAAGRRVPTTKPR
ncbi:MAG: serine hydrolase domain-containing protein [Gemmatimonadales bacterium]